jgi:hypothetical protein
VLARLLHLAAAVLLVQFFQVLVPESNLVDRLDNFACVRVLVYSRAEVEQADQVLLL